MNRTRAMPPILTRRSALSLLAAGSLALHRSAHAQSATEDIPGKPSSDKYPHASRYMRQLIAEGQFNGCLLTIRRHGQPNFYDGAGWLDAAHKIAMPRNAICYLASLSKPITAVATIALMEQGKIKLDDPIDKWMPELANRVVLRNPAGPLNETYPSPRPIKVADLLDFHCGYGGDGPRGPFSTAQRAANTSPNTALTLSPTDFLNELHPIPLQFAPGQYWLYDVPADLLGVLIQRVSGKRYSEFLDEHVFGPIGMPDTAFWAPPQKQSRVAQYPAGTHADTALPHDPLFQSGAHGMCSTLDDYMRFTQMLLHEGESNGKQIVSVDNVRAMRVDHLNPAEHKTGGFFDRYPGRGFGWCGAVRTEAIPIGPSVGSYNWAGASGVWMMVDYARGMTISIMCQHPSGGPPPGAAREGGGNNIGPAPVHSVSSSGKPYLPQTVWNDLMQTEIYKDVS
jgi:CubicO group peptidase (beta-lactamase class C family)